MQKLNCKVGDLAIVVRAKLPGNLGSIVQVLGPETGKPFSLARADHVWQVRAAGGRASLNYVWQDGRTVALVEGPVPDGFLRPVSGLADDDHTSAGARRSRKKPRGERLATVR